jgi:hypothetical protein
MRSAQPWSSGGGSSLLPVGLTQASVALMNLARASPPAVVPKRMSVEGRVLPRDVVVRNEAALSVLISASG